MSYTHLESVNEDAFVLSTFEMLEQEPAFELPLVFDPILESILKDFIPSSPTPGVPNNSGLCSPTPSSNTHSHVAPSLRISLKAKRYRSRKREELETLRNAVKTLEVRLAALKTRSSQGESALGPYPRIWEAMATLESTRRQEAERQNKELREAMEFHLHMAQKLDQVISRVCAQSILGVAS